MRYATSVCGLRLLVYEALRDLQAPLLPSVALQADVHAYQATSVCGLELLVYAALSC